MAVDYLRLAIQLANQEITELDKQGQPAILHTRAVASDVMLEHGDTVQIVAWLHDVVEDTRVTFDDLYHLGFSREIINAVIAITRNKADPNETYLGSYIERVKENPIARIVKIADLKHNLSRVDTLPHNQRGMRDRYEKALKILERF